MSEYIFKNLIARMIDELEQLRIKCEAQPNSITRALWLAYYDMRAAQIEKFIIALGRTIPGGN